jgi:hypothetical protein
MIRLVMIIHTIVVQTYPHRLRTTVWACKHLRHVSKHIVPPTTDAQQARRLDRISTTEIAPTQAFGNPFDKRYAENFTRLRLSRQ